MKTIGVNSRLELELLSPLHISSGRPPLQDDLDYVRGRMIYVIDLERMFERLPPERLERAESAAPLSQLLNGNELPRLARYMLNNPAAGGRVPRIVEQIKDARDQPYLPGSSLKGAIRTAIAWAMLEQHPIPHVDDLGQNPRYAAAPLEGQLFGLQQTQRGDKVNPNKDLMRALQVADSRPLELNEIQLAQAAVYSLRGAPGHERLQAKGDEWRFFLEVLPAGARIQTSVRLDTYLLEPSIARRLTMDGKQQHVAGWVERCNAFSQAVIAREQQFYARYGLSALKAFYDGLAQRAADCEPGRACLLQLAWGTGWTSKTVGDHLPEPALAELRHRYRLGRANHPIFPKSRRLVERGTAPEAPLGWVRITVREDTP